MDIFNAVNLGFDDVKQKDSGKNQDNSAQERFKRESCGKAVENVCREIDFDIGDCAVDSCQEDTGYNNNTVKLP